MKELKFRAWNPKTQSYAWPYPEPFYIIGEVTVFDMLKQLDMSVIEYNDLVIEQYVGVKDCKDIDVYEGDIIEVFDFDFDSDDTPYKTKVGTLGEIDLVGEECGFTLLQWAIGSYVCVFRVISNINQNPELNLRLAEENRQRIRTALSAKKEE